MFWYSSLFENLDHRNWIETMAFKQCLIEVAYLNEKVCSLTIT